MKQSWSGLGIIISDVCDKAMERLLISHESRIITSIFDVYEHLPLTRVISHRIQFYGI